MEKKILFVESALSGHRKAYHNVLMESNGISNSILITPKQTDSPCNQVIDETINLQPRNFREYFVWLKYIQDTAKRNNVDVIHILNGDLLYKFWGLGLKKLLQFRTIVTYHHIKNDMAHNLSLRLIMKKIQTGVVHTSLLKNRFRKIKNIELIDYPYLGNINLPAQEISRKYFKIDSEAIVVAALGGTRFEKGADLLVKAFNHINDNRAILLIAGEEGYFKKETLEKLSMFSPKIIFYMNHLTDAEWAMALSAADHVVFPYRKNFTGASGPLTDAVWFRRNIIGADNESLGDIIKSNHLGYVFECENELSLAAVIDQALKSTFEADSCYEKFRRKISKEYFIKKYQELYTK